jgi:5-methylcytosine-specific restriction endonuclease McrA
MIDTFKPQPKPPKKEKVKKPIKKTSKKREVVRDKTYYAVLNRDKVCQICGTSRQLELHHIVYRSEDKKRINDIGNCIFLCSNCHKLAHSNKKKYKPILIGILAETYRKESN